MKCCGVRSYRDWNTSIWYKDNVDKEVPATCCKSDSEKPSCYKKSTFDLTNIYTKVSRTDLIPHSSFKSESRIWLKLDKGSLRFQDVTKER